ncbi:hypothetical protein HQ545_06235 [Candidatus Woesearchaeota archaeon]|nr:hypothetical protein [Candidatus Woesearchaeota archaeon]
MINIPFHSDADYVAMLDTLVVESRKGLTRERADALITEYSKLEKSCLADSQEYRPPTRDERLAVIHQMNKIYFNGGRIGTDCIYQEASMAAEYFLKLLEGVYTGPDGQEEQLAQHHTKEFIIERAFCAFLDFTREGHCFLYGHEPNIPSETMRSIALKLVDKISKTHYSDRQCASRSLTILTGMKAQSVLPSAQGSWLEDHWYPPRTDFDEKLTNTKLIPEAIEYAQEHLSYFK